LILQALLIILIWLIISLFNWKIDLEDLKGCCGWFCILSFFSFIFPLATFIHLLYDISVFNNNVTQYIKQSDSFEEFQRLYDNKYD